MSYNWRTSRKTKKPFPLGRVGHSETEEFLAGMGGHVRRVAPEEVVVIREQGMVKVGERIVELPGGYVTTVPVYKKLGRLGWQ